MQKTDPRLSQTVGHVAGIVAVLVALTLPVSYYFVSYRYQLGILDAQAEINARIASAVISSNPEMWRFMNARLEEFLSRRPGDGHAEVRRIVDNDNMIIAQSADALDSPTITRSAEVLDAGVVVGRIEIVRSLRPVLIRTGTVAFFAILFSWIAYLALKNFPLRALSRALAENSRLLREAERRANEYAQLFEETGQRAQEQTALSMIADAASQSLQTDEMLRNALDKTLEVTNRTIGLVRLKDDVSGGLRLVAHKGISERYATALNSELRIGRKALEVLTTGAIHIMNDPSPADMMKDSNDEGMKSRLWVPIQSHGRILGVLTVASRIVRPFEAREVELLKAIGSIFGTAVANAVLFEKTQRDLRQIQALRDIDQAITSTMDLQTRLNILLEKIDLFFPFPIAAAIGLVNKDTGGLELACDHLGEADWKKEALTAPSSPAKQAVDTRTRVIVRNVASAAQHQGSYLGQGLVSQLALPLIVKNEAIGVLSLYARDDHDFTQEEVESLEILASQAAIAIHEAQLYDETERRRREAEELARLARSLTETLDTSAVSDRIVASLHELFHPKHVTLRLLQPDGSLRAVKSTGEVFSRSPGGEAVPPGMGLTSRVIAEGRPIWSADMLNDPEIRLTERMRDYQLRTGNRSMISVPLRAHEKIIGALVLSDQVGRGYSESEVALVQTFADQAALALENARLYEEVSQKIQALQLKTSELERANKAKDEFLSVMSHELRTPLNVVIGYSAMLKAEILGELNSGQKQALDKILARANDQLHMINTILQATQLGAGAVTVAREDVRLGKFLDGIRSSYDLPLNKAIALHWEYSSALPVIKTDSEKLKHILQNIIDNAIKFTERGRITISVQHIPNAGVLEFAVADTGVGIPQPMLPIIFEMFRQVDSTETRQFEGVGLGLYIVKNLTGLLGGKVVVESEEGKGSTFVVTIPAEVVAEATDSVPLRDLNSQFQI